MGFKRCGPHEAMVLSGCFRSRPRIVSGRRIWVWSRFQQVQRISLSPIMLLISSTDINTSNGVPVNCIGTAQVKIQGHNQEMLETACKNFLGKPQSYIRNIVLEIIEGHQHAIIGTMTAQEIACGHKKFSTKMIEASSLDLNQMGITVNSYFLKSVHDNVGHLRGLQLQQRKKNEEKK